MAKYAFVDFKVELDNATPTLTTISSYVTAINGWTKERLVEEVTGAGDADDKWAGLGFLQKSEVELSGPLDDTADGLFDIAKNWNDDSERTLQLTFDVGVASVVETVEVLKMREVIAPTRGAFTQFTLVVRPTGAIT